MTLITLCLALLFLPLCPSEMRDAAAIIFIAAISSRLLVKPVKQSPNGWLAALLIYIPVSIVCAPNIRLLIGSENVGGLWMWRSLAWAFGYFMVYLAVHGICFNRERNRRIIAWAIITPALLSALYCYAQALGMDQWQYTLSYNEIGSPDVPSLTAMIGNPTYLAVYLALSLPFAVLLAPWWVAVIIGAPILFLHSETAFFGAPLAFALWKILTLKKYSKSLVVMVLLIVSLFVGLIFSNKLKVNPSGRIAVWSNTITDWQSPPILVKPDDSPLNKRAYQMTGRGIGSFQYLYPLKHYQQKQYGQTIWTSAHNEYIEALYSIGLIGLILMLGALGFMFYNARHAIEDNFFSAVFISSIIAVFSAFTLPVWHIEPLRFISVVLFSLLASYSRQRP